MGDKGGTKKVLQPWVRVGTGKGGGKTQPGQHATTQQQRRGVPPCIRPAVVLLPAPPVGVAPTAANRVSPRDLQRISQEYMVSNVPRQFCGKGASSPTLVHHPELPPVFRRCLQRSGSPRSILSSWAPSGSARFGPIYVTSHVSIQLLLSAFMFL